MILSNSTKGKPYDDATRLLASIVDSSSDAIISKDLGGIVTSWNRGAERMFGYGATEVVGRSIALIIPAQRITEETAILASIARGDPVEPFETARLHKAGRALAVSVSVSALHDANGIIVGLSEVVCDISERKAAATSLRETEERFHLMFDQMPEGIQIIGFDWRYRYANQSVATHSRVPHAELIGHTMLELFPRFEGGELHAAIRDCMADRVYRRLESRIDHPDGTYSWFDFRVQPSPEGVFMLSIDITQRKRADALLHASNERFRQLTESLPQLIWYCGPAGDCQFVSRQWVEFTGVPAERLLGNQCLDVIHPDDLSMLIEAWNAAVAAGSELHSEFRIRRFDGKYRWFSSRGTPQRNEQGRIERWYGANTDIEIERRAREAHLRNQKMEALGTLAGGIAHDFNNVLLAISGNTTLALEDMPADNPARQCLLDIEQASRRAAELVRRILAFSRQEEPRREVVSLQPVIEEARKLLRATLPAQIELRAQYEAATPRTVCDTSQVHQILINLVTNAAHAIGDRPGFIEITLAAAVVDEEHPTLGLRPGRFACLSVTDNGCGMEPSTIERIFDPFFTTKPTGQGTGMGLSVVDGIVKTHGGAITVYSEPEKGTAFRLYFPSTADPEPPVPPPKPAVAIGHGQRVLYVDDDELLVSLVTRKLKRLGYAVTGESDPEAALARFLTDPHEFDVVVTDLSMPRLPGFELARRLLAARSNLPVVATSGYVRPEDQETARRIGIKALILKPNTCDEIGTVLDEVFRTV